MRGELLGSIILDALDPHRSAKRFAIATVRRALEMAPPLEPWWMWTRYLAAAITIKRIETMGRQ